MDRCVRVFSFFYSRWGPTPANPSELQARLTRSIRDRTNAAVVQKPAAIEHDPLDPLVDRSLRDRLADRLGPFEVAAGDTLAECALQLRIHRRGRHERLAGQIVDDLRVDVGHA